MDYLNSSEPTRQERATLKKIKSEQSVKKLLTSMKNEYSGHTGYGKVYHPGDNHPFLG